MNAHVERPIQSSVVNNHLQLANMSFNEISIKEKPRNHLKRLFFAMTFYSICDSSRLRDFISSLIVTLLSRAFLICYIEK